MCVYIYIYIYYVYMYVIVVTAALGLRVYISGRPLVPVLQLLCNTSFPCKWLHYIYSSTYCFRLWVRIMTFILRF